MSFKKSLTDGTTTDTETTTEDTGTETTDETDTTTTWHGDNIPLCR